MINYSEAEQLFQVYYNELTQRILPFWVNRCEDEKNGGYFNCFDNTGAVLLSHNKYIWSQGRFLWLWSRLTVSPIFAQNKEVQKKFLHLADLGYQFLAKNSFVAPDVMKCVFLTDEEGNPLLLQDSTRFDRSIFADCFVVCGFAAYSIAKGDGTAFELAYKLYQSILQRVKKNDFLTLPYPLDLRYKAHSIPMILINVTCELLDAAKKFRKSIIPSLKINLESNIDDILVNFRSDDNTIREVIKADNSAPVGLIGNYINPGHTLECMWFLLDASKQLGCQPKICKEVEKIAIATLNAGWDSQYGGILHYCYPNGGIPQQEDVCGCTEDVCNQVLDGWGDKLWWVHSESLYITLRLYLETGNADFKVWHDKIHEYTFKLFPNTDDSIGEWIQILKRNGEPQDKVVALPVKDPYHIARNLLLIAELLYK